jgi:hypothetical protein
VDIIFCSGNGVAPVDDEWFDHARAAEILGLPMRLCPPEEMIWSKAYVCERERHDGADVIHLLRDCGPTMDWSRLLRRFDAHWRVLYAHVVLFGFVYPTHAHAVPAWVCAELAQRLERERTSDLQPGVPPVCRGTLLSREQYLVDIEQQGYVDGRLHDPEVHMSAADIRRWTAAIPGRQGNGGRAASDREKNGGG